MRKCAFWLSLTTLLTAAVPLVAKPEASVIDAFKLPSVTGKAWSLHDCKDKKAVVVLFIGTQCPVNNAYMPKVAELEREYRDQGVQFVAINANAHDSMEAIKTHATKHGLTFPVLRDDQQQIASRFGAERHPTAFVLDGSRTIRYRGRIDDQFGVGFARAKPSRRDLAVAIDEVLAGKSVTTATTKVEGCFITRAPVARKGKTDVTYTKDISRIVQNRCQECHRPGQIGPMPLMNYDDVSSWSAMIREAVSDQRMPPWHADPKHDSFRNDRRLSKEDRTKLLAWIDAGCPQGNDKDLPEPKKFVEGWNIGKPDAVFTMKDSYTVPAKAGKGGIPYKYFIIPTNYDEDRWVQAVEAKPGNNAVVHHIIVYVVQGGKRVRNLGDGIGSGMLVAFAPGDLGAVLAPGTAKKLPKGASLALQMHYTPNGTEQTDRSSVGLIFAKEPPKAEIRTRAIAQQALFIWPKTDNQQFSSRTTLQKDAVLYSLFPHMHLRGKDFKFEAIFPDGKRELLLNVPRYDFGWQSVYMLKEPIRLPAGTKIECTAHFDNSEKNLNNPNASAMVFWGEQTWQEMMIGFIDYAYTDEMAGKGK